MISKTGTVEFDSALLTNIVVTHRALTDAITDAGDLNMTQYQMLLIAHGLPEGARVADMASILDLRSNTVTIAADQLEARDLIRRQKHPTDRRAIVLKITPEGANLVALIDRTLAATIVAAWAALPGEMAIGLMELISILGPKATAGMSRGATPRVTLRFLIAVTALYRGIVQTLTDAGSMSLTQFRILLKTHDMTDRARISDVAAALSLRTSTMTPAVDQLENAELLIREDDPTDRRAIILTITEEGKRILPSLEQALAEYAAEALAPLEVTQRAELTAASILISDDFIQRWSRGHS